jgi:ubiquinone/menaquinone biosynthesis C-methylase UbiE
LLSVGCGPAIIENKLHLLRRDIRFLCLDINREMLCFVPKYLNPIQANALHLPFFNESIDFVFCITSLEFMNKPRQVLTEINRVLKYRGTFLGLLLNPHSDYVNKKLNQCNSYIGKNYQLKSYEIITRTINNLFNQNTSCYGLYVENNDVTDQSSRNNARLLIMKAIK